jgi:GTP pyrophosphokinase
MNQIAEKGVAAHWSYKGVNKSESELDNWLTMVREVLENPDVSALEFLDKFHEGLLAAEIYVFTPKGESKPLPKGATALDFAYYIHSKIGNRAIAAKVNHRLVPLSHELKNGDQVEIITAESQKPQREWLEYVHTPKAKEIIYDSLKADIEDAITKGQNILETELGKLGVKVQNRVIRKLLLEYKLNNKDELYNKIATGVVKLDDLDKILRKNNENKFVKYWKLQFFPDSVKDEDEDLLDEDIPAEKKPAIDKKKDYLLKENSVDQTLTYKVAECCNPIPGDAIVGFVDADNNVVVHKKVCPKAISLATVQGEKIVNAKWTKHTFLSFLARVCLRGIDRMGIVNEITQFITLDLSVNIRKIHFETHDGIFDGYIDLYVHDTQDLDVIIKRLLKVKGVESVTRSDVKSKE